MPNNINKSLSVQIWKMKYLLYEDLYRKSFGRSTIRTFRSNRRKIYNYFSMFYFNHIKSIVKISLKHKTQDEIRLPGIIFLQISSIFRSLKLEVTMDNNLVIYTKLILFVLYHICPGFQSVLN